MKEKDLVDLFDEECFADLLDDSEDSEEDLDEFDRDLYKKMAKLVPPPPSQGG